MYNCVGGIVIGSYVVFLLVFIPGVITGWEEWNNFCMAPGGSPVAYIVNYNYCRGRL